MRFFRLGWVLLNAESGGAGSGGGASAGTSSGGSGTSGGNGGSSASDGGAAGKAGGSAPATASAFVGSGGAAGADGGKGASSSEGGAAGDGSKETAKPPSPKHKVKRDGQEREYSVEELIALAGDDYEEELTVDKAKVRKKRAELLRDAQLGGAAWQRMQEAANVKKTYSEKVERIASGDIRGFIEDHLPADKPEAFFEIAKAVMSDKYKLEQLKAKDPDAYIAEIEKRKTARAKAQEESTRVAAERKARAEQMQKRTQERVAALPKAFEALGLKPSALKGLALERIFATADAQGYDLPVEHAAGLVRDAVKSELAATLADLDGPAILEWLGPDVAKKIRGAEMKKLEREGDGAGNGEAPPAPKPKAKEPKQPRSLEDFANPNRWM